MQQKLHGTLCLTCLQTVIKKTKPVKWTKVYNANAPAHAAANIRKTIPMSRSTQPG